MEKNTNLTEAFNAVKDSDGRVVYLSKPFDGRELRQHLARQ